MITEAFVHQRFARHLSHLFRPDGWIDATTCGSEHQQHKRYEDIDLVAFVLRCAETKRVVAILDLSHAGLLSCWQTASCRGLGRRYH